MNKIFLGSIASLMLLPAVCLAQSNPPSTPQPPASWVAFEQQETAKRVAFFQQMKADREAFLNANPDARAYVQQMHEVSKARLAAWRAQHPRPSTNALPTTPNTSP